MLDSKSEEEFFTKELFNELYELTNGFTDDKLPYWPPVRPEGESFADFVDKGAKALIEENPELVKRLL